MQQLEMSACCLLRSSFRCPHLVVDEIPRTLKVPMMKLERGGRVR